MSLPSDKILSDCDLKSLLELNVIMNVVEDQLLETLKLIRETRHKNNDLIEHLTSNSNVVCFYFAKQNILKNN